jgi:hypothetical protein
MRDRMFLLLLMGVYVTAQMVGVLDHFRWTTSFLFRLLLVGIIAAIVGSVHQNLSNLEFGCSSFFGSVDQHSGTIKLISREAV